MGQARDTFDYGIIETAGALWTAIQFLAIPLSFPFAYFMSLPSWRLGTLLGEAILGGRSTSYLLTAPVAAAVLWLLIVALLIGVHRRNAACAKLLALNVAGYWGIALYGLLSKGRIGPRPPFADTIVLMNLINIGLTSLVLLILLYGLWKYRITHPTAGKFAFAALLLCIPAVIVLVMVARNQYGLVSGHFYTTVGIPFTDKVAVLIKPLDRNVHITSGDPAPPYLVVEATGSYEIRRLPEGEYYVWAATSAYPDQRLFSETIYRIRVRPKESANLDLTLVPGGSISGRIVASSGGPLTFAAEPNNESMVIAEYGPLGWQAQYSTYASEDGTYSFRNLPPGTYTIGIFTDNPARKPVTVYPGKETYLLLTKR